MVKTLQNKFLFLLFLYSTFTFSQTLYKYNNGIIYITAFDFKKQEVIEGEKYAVISHIEKKGTDFSIYYNKNGKSILLITFKLFIDNELNDLNKNNNDFMKVTPPSYINYIDEKGYKYSIIESENTLIFLSYNKPLSNGVYQAYLITPNSH